MFVLACAHWSKPDDKSHLIVDNRIDKKCFTSWYRSIVPMDMQLFSDFNMFGDLKTPAGVKALDSFLADHSYIEG